jgi:hypothetical protein
MASAINAQCALSCSLQTVPRSSAYETQNIHSHRGGHACCQPQKTPARNDQNRQQQQPCPDPVLTISEVGFATPIQHLDPPRDFAGHLIYSPDVALPVRQIALPAVVDSSGTPNTPAFFILRI